MLPNYYSLRAAVKAIYQFMYLLWLLMLRIPAPDVLLLQASEFMQYSVLMLGFHLIYGSRRPLPPFRHFYALDWRVAVG